MISEEYKENLMHNKTDKQNEFIILCEEGFEFFEAHLREKESMLSGPSIGRKRADQRNLLVLSYPGPKEENEDFNKFFSSPDNLNPFCNSYCGVFAVELTDYVDCPESPRLAELFGFIRDRKEMTFVLFAMEDGADGVSKLADRVSRKTGCKVASSTERGLEWKNRHESRNKTFGY